MTFRQSLEDFPLTVDLGREVPDWGLTRWGGGGLRFRPDDGEGFSLRGDGRQVLYRGGKRSHRFTILGGDRFEYDCILNKEPDCNTVCLTMDGAENYNFFRQPDFVRDPFLKGSYAVYKKETLLGEGTGKLCHIHRPKIIDSRGRWVWGDLSIAGDRLCITIPETWLAEAKYPVIVDPIIGTNTIGSQITGPDPNNGGYDRPMLDGEMALNQYPVNQSGGGNCTAYVYAYYSNSDSYITPCLYTDNSNKPYLRKSKNEQEVRVDITSQRPAGWRSNTFSIDGSITAGANVWFGVKASWFTTRFDYGGKCYKFWPDYDSYPEDYDEDLPPPVINITQWDTYCTIKWSWYFDYTATQAQNFTRTLTQGVTLTDTRKLTANYKKTLTMNGQNGTALGHGSSYIRKHMAQVKGTDTTPWLRGLYRSITETLRVLTPLGYCRELYRSLLETARLSATANRSTGNNRNIGTTAGSNDGISRSRGIFRALLETAQTGDGAVSFIGLLRRLIEQAGSTDSAGKWNVYIRGLYEQAGNNAETGHQGEYYREAFDTAGVAGLPLRSLGVFIKLVTVGLVRDYLLRRFLKSNEEIVLKSAVCRDIEIESRIH
ncbi:hypothetical protein TREPR_2195 [Treponema primitia ZAS-2]|uniref:Uncharacterized protein n=1 Tax=Treponema primitia (strain ATCC BAA-887 / DSM 12427 / ZAS-2) TaxID=545694 RepID=F5YIK3_TREPZ|nr:hypothetical protein [Treponema primitia]AEF85237.1 hypothetical protein TREPR_2195 [Treponema primitia ZAS-2]